MKKINKKSFVVGLAAIAIAVGAAVNVGLFSKKDKLMSNLTLENVEALADFWEYYDKTDFFAKMSSTPYYKHQGQLHLKIKGVSIDLVNVEIGGIIGFLYECKSVLYPNTCDTTKERFEKVQ